MNANRSIFGFIKSPVTLLFLGGFIVAAGACLWRTVAMTPVRSICVSPVSFYEIKQDKQVTLTHGVFRTYRDGIARGHVTFTGSISRFRDGKLTAPPVQVNRENHFTGYINGNRVMLTITGHNRRLGDESSNSDVRSYVFPQMEKGETGTSGLYMLDNKVLGTGTETALRLACIR